MSELMFGARCFVTGFSLMLRPGVKRWACAPMLLSALIYGLLFWYAAAQVDAFVAGIEGALPSWLSWLGGVFWVVFWVAALCVLTFTFVLVAGVVSSPFNGPLAAAAERALTGRAPVGAGHGFLAALPVLLVQEGKKIFYAVLGSIPFLVLFFIPVVNLVAPPLWFLWNAWVAALGFTDYAMDNNGVLFRDMRRLLGRYRMASFGFGGAAFLALSVPVLNLFAVPAAVAGGAVLWTERLKPSHDAD